MIFLRILFLFYLALLVCLPARAASVVFLNPGHADEAFWTVYASFMEKAAQDLGMQLQVLYGERDVHTTLQQAREVMASAQKPDYVLFVNEQYSGPEILRIFSGSDIKLFSVHSTLTTEQQAIVGTTRQRYSNWIGSLVPNDEEAGYLMAQALISHSPGGIAEMLAFSGAKQTPSSTLRELGMQRALGEHPYVRLRQVVYGEWSERRAYEQAKSLLPRYPKVSLVWSANDEMTFGVQQAAREQGRQLRYSALNNSEKALRQHVDGRIDVLAAGHFILGGCALVMLNDYEAGLDFAERGGKDQTARLFRLLSKSDALHLMRNLRGSSTGLDFRSFSAVGKPDMKRYDFSIEALLR